MRFTFLFVMLMAAATAAQAPREVQDAPKPAVPAPDAGDKALINLVVQAQKLAQTACDETPALQHYRDTQKQIDAALQARYPGFRFDWSKGAFTPKEK